MGQSPSSDDYSFDESEKPFLQGNAEFGVQHPSPKLFCDVAPKKAPKESLLVSVRAPVGALNISDRCYGIGRGLCAVVANHDLLLPRFAWYMLTVTRNELWSIATGSTYEAVSADEVASMTIMIPLLSEQRTIAAFLDRETARIDTLIEKKQRQIELLQEKRSALISNTVTKGLDPNAPMKDSGVEWLGEIPAHWEAVRFKRCVEFITSGPRGWAKFFSDDGDLFIRIANLSRNSIDLDLTDVQHVVPPIGAEAIRTGVRAGDILISITADLGSVAVVPNQVGTAYISQHIALARPMNKRAHPRWLGFSIFSESCRNQLRALGYGGTKVQLGLEDVQNLILCMPPRDEQDRIVSWLDTEFYKQSMVTQKIHNSVTMLLEYRTALISAAVTGKIDVRKEVL